MLSEVKKEVYNEDKMHFEEFDVNQADSFETDSDSDAEVF